MGNRFLGWHPTAYVGMFGISDNPQDISRKSGTRVMHARTGYTLPFGLGASVGWWSMRDTGSTGFDLDTLTSINPPFGYSREEFAAQGWATMGVVRTSLNSCGSMYRGMSR